MTVIVEREQQKNIQVLEERTCGNCRNQDTGFSYCKRWQWLRERNKRDRGKDFNTKCCTFWAYKPNGMWKTSP